MAAGSRTQVYVGHALYKHVNNGGWEQAWMNPEEVPNQIRYNQKLDGIEGSVLFSYNDMKPSDLSSLPADQQPKHQAKNTAIELLEGEAFAHPTLVPAKPWLSDGQVATPAAPRSSTESSAGKPGTRRRPASMRSIAEPVIRRRSSPRRARWWTRSGQAARRRSASPSPPTMPPPPRALRRRPGW